MLKIPKVLNPLYFGLAAIIVFSGFFIDTKAWQKIVCNEIPEITFKHAYISNGKYILGKYLPGKVWIILGKAAYLKDRFKKSTINLTSYSFFYQLVLLFAAILTSIAVIFFIYRPLFWISTGILLLVLFFFFFLYRPTLNFIKQLAYKVFKKKIEIPPVSANDTFHILKLSLLNWVLWSISFYVFLLSVLPKETVGIEMGLLFPISSLIGIVVLIAPGGIGFREGFLAFGLTALGMSVKDAASVSVLSRLWFLTGELLFFLSAIVLEVIDKRKKG